MKHYLSVWYIFSIETKATEQKGEVKSSKPTGMSIMAGYPNLLHGSDIFKDLMHYLWNCKGGGVGVGFANDD